MITVKPVDADTAKLVEDLGPKLFTRIFGCDYSAPHWRESVGAIMKHPDATMLLALDGGEIVGLCIAQLLRQFFTPVCALMQIPRLWVDPEQRGKGIAKRLLGDAEAWGAGRGAKFAVAGSPFDYSARADIGDTTATHERAIKVFRASGYDDLELILMKEIG